MKKFLKLMTVSILALAMVLSLASCSKLEIDDVEDAMEDLVDDDEERYYIEEIDSDMEDALIEALESLFDIKGDVEGIVELCDDEDKDEPWVMAIGFEKTADAKNVAKDLEDNIVDLFVEIAIASYEDLLKESGRYNSSEIKELIKEVKQEAADEVEEMLPKDFVVERKGNVVFFGDEDLIETVLEAIKDAKK